MKKFISYLLTVIVTAVIVGGGFYWWQNNTSEITQELELKSEEIEKEKEVSTNQELNNSKKTFEDKDLGILFQHSANWNLLKRELITSEPDCATNEGESNTDRLKIILPPLGIFGTNKSTCTILKGMHPGYTHFANKDDFNKALSDAENQDWRRAYQSSNLDILVELKHGPPFFEGLSAIIFNPSSKYNTIKIEWYSEALQKDNYRAYADIDKTAVLMADPELPKEVLEGVQEFYEILDTIKFLGS